MGWNNGYERKKFDIAQRKKAAKYRKLGMTKEQITEILKFDLEQFKSDRRFYTHTIALEPNKYDPSEDAEDKSPLLNLFSDVLTISIDGSEAHSRFWWIEELNDLELTVRVKMLPQSELELLTMYVFEDFNQAELAEIFQIAQQNISKRITSIKNFLSNKV